MNGPSLSSALSTRLLILSACAMALAAPACVGTTAAVSAQTPPPGLAVLPFEIEDTSGETGPPDRHASMLAATTAAAAEEIGRAGLFSVVPEAKVAEAVAAVNSGTYLRRCNGCELEIAQRAGARYVLVGWIYKMSTLVLTLHVDIKEAETGRSVYARVFDFRGDNEKAYAHAVRTMVRSLGDAMRSKPQDFGAAAARQIDIADGRGSLAVPAAAGH